MPRQNIIFAIVAPLILMAIIAVIVVGIGETLLAVHHWAEHYYHVGDVSDGPEQNRQVRELAALPSVFVALGHRDVVPDRRCGSLAARAPAGALDSLNVHQSFADPALPSRAALRGLSILTYRSPANSLLRECPVPRALRYYAASLPHQVTSPPPSPTRRDGMPFPRASGLGRTLILLSLGVALHGAALRLCATCRIPRSCPRPRRPDRSRICTSSSSGWPSSSSSAPRAGCSTCSGASGPGPATSCRSRPTATRPSRSAGRSLPAVILVIMAVPTIRTIFALETAPPPSPDGGPPLEVEVIGKQWWWEFRYPEVTLRERRAADDRQRDGHPDRADGLPEHQLRQRDPQLLGPAADGQDRRDAEPRQRALVHRRGSRPVLRAVRRVLRHPARPDADERHRDDAHGLPGLGRPAARGPPSRSPTSRSAGAEAFVANGCAGCHTIDGNPTAIGKIGPNLSHFGSRTTLAAGILQNTPENLAALAHDPQAIKPGNFMPNLHLRPH